MRRSTLLMLALACGWMAGSPAFAQQTARQLLREAMEQRGFYSGVSYQGAETAVLRVDTGGGNLHISEGFAAGDGEGLYMAILRNTTDRPFCIRYNGTLTPAGAVTARTQGNVRIESRQHIVLMVASATNVDARHGIAFWAPDPSLDLPCTDAAPAGLEAWANAPVTDHFPGSRLW